MVNLKPFGRLVFCLNWIDGITLCQSVRLKLTDSLLRLGNSFEHSPLRSANECSLSVLWVFSGCSECVQRVLWVCKGPFSRYTFAKDFSANICCHIFLQLQLFFYCCVCLVVARVTCRRELPWVALICSELHWSSCWSLFVASGRAMWCGGVKSDEVAAVSAWLE